MYPFLNLRILKFLPIHLRRTSHFVSELPVEVGKVAETIVVRDFGHTPRRTAQRLAGGFDPKLCQIFNGPESEGLLKTAHKIAFAQMRQPGKFLYGKRVGEVLLDYRRAQAAGFQQPQAWRDDRCRVPAMRRADRRSGAAHFSAEDRRQQSFHWMQRKI